MRNPEVGDVYVLIDETILPPNLMDRALSAIGVDRKPIKQIDIEPRLVVDRTPTTVFYVGTDCGDCMHAHWLSEWHDWQEDAVFVRGHDFELSPAEMEGLFGSCTLPFHFDYENKETRSATVANAQGGRCAASRLRFKRAVCDFSSGHGHQPDSDDEAGFGIEAF